MIEKIKIKDFADVITGGTPSTAKLEYWENGNIPWLNSGELNQDIIQSSKNFITELGLQSSSTKLMPQDTILIALTGTTTGKVGYLTFKACANQSVTGILPSKKHFPKYLYYFLNSIRKKVISEAYGGAQPHISQGYVKELEIPLPPPPQQQKIANILDAADALIQNDKALIAKYDELTQALFLDMFGDLISNPKGWKVDKIGEYINIKHGYAFKSDFFVDESDYILLTPGNFYEEGGYRNQGNKQKFYKGEIPNGYLLKSGDILIAMTEQASGLLGSTIFVPNSGNYLHNQRLGLIEFKKDIIPSFIYTVFNQVSIRKRIHMDATGTKVRHTSPGKMISIEIGIPDLKLQYQFAEQFALIEEQKVIAKQSLEKSKELFNSLLQKAFKGELV